MAQSNNHCVKLAALGITNCLGNSRDEVEKALFSASPQPISTNCTLLDGTHRPFGFAKLPECNFESDWDSLKSRNTQLIQNAYAQIANEVSAVVSKFGRSRIAIVVGSSTSGISEAEDAITFHQQTGKMPEDYQYTRQEIGAVSQVIKKLSGAIGPAYTISTACSSSAKVFRSAADIMKLGIADAVIVGGSDSYCKLTVNGFNALGLLCESQTNPFSANRAGINIGEGAALFLLTKEPGGIQLLGTGESSDAYHFSSPDPEAGGAIRALKEALIEAHLSAADITYLNLHGTGTIHNDAMEAKAVNSVFGNTILCSSTKPRVGHLLGASGATEAAFCFMMLENYLNSGKMPIPAHLFDGEYDKALPPINLCHNLEWISPGNRAAVASNSFGFGGSNSAIILGAES